MINNYQIKIDNNEKVLVLYLNYNYEFASFNKNKKNSLKKEIKKYIKKINYTGRKIVLSIGGIMLASLLVINNPNNDNIDLVYINNSIIPNNTINFVLNKSEDNFIVEESIIEDNIETEEKKEDIVPQIDVKKEIIVTPIKEEKKDEKKEEVKKSNEIVMEKDINDIPKEEIKEEKIEEKKENSDAYIQKSEEIIENNSENMVTIYRKNGNIITLSMDDYLIGVVGAEMPASFNIEALKAQTILARTYALKKIESGVKLTDTVSTQSYLDNSELEEKWGNSFQKYYEKIKEAVNDTKDLAIYYNDQLIDAVYHSTSNGKTEDSINVWGNSIPYLKSVDSSWDQEASSYLRTTTKELDNVLNILGISDFNFEILSRNESGRIDKIKVDNKIFTGIEFRTLLGLRSSDFDIELVDDSINITTRGYGHGVGLSQYGANILANRGYTFKDIIKHYYLGVEIK